jgi:hypothetical protein
MVIIPEWPHLHKCFTKALVQPRITPRKLQTQPDLQRPQPSDRSSGEFNPRDYPLYDELRQRLSHPTLEALIFEEMNKSLKLE